MTFCGDDYVNILLATVLAVINRDSVHRRSDDEINVKIAGSIPVANQQNFFSASLFSSLDSPWRYP